MKKIKENHIIKTTITFNPRIQKKAQVIAALYEKGKFSTNIKQALMKQVCSKKEVCTETLFTNMNDESLISSLSLLLYTIDNKGIDVSKILLGYCKIPIQQIALEYKEPNKPTVHEEEIEDLTEDVLNCGMDLF